MLQLYEESQKFSRLQFWQYQAAEELLLKWLCGRLYERDRSYEGVLISP